ncbi:MAG: pyridoxamine 5'-phosphate oxidase family protein, partial [Rhodospirillales bacterium]
MDTVQESSRYVIASREALEAIYKKPVQTTLLKQTDCITPPGRALIAASPLIMLATAGPDGVDCSPKGDAPGFVQVLDDRTLLIPDRPGNNRLDGIKNILDNPKVGIIFLVPGANITYRVNGRDRKSVV